MSPKKQIVETVQPVSLPLAGLRRLDFVTGPPPPITGMRIGRWFGGRLFAEEKLLPVFRSKEDLNLGLGLSEAIWLPFLEGIATTSAGNSLIVDY